MLCGTISEILIPELGKYCLDSQHLVPNPIRRFLTTQFINTSDLLLIHICTHLPKYDQVPSIGRTDAFPIVEKKECWASKYIFGLSKDFGFTAEFISKQAILMSNGCYDMTLGNMVPRVWEWRKKRASVGSLAIAQVSVVPVGVKNHWSSLILSVHFSF